MYILDMGVYTCFNCAISDTILKEYETTPPTGESDHELHGNINGSCNREGTQYFGACILQAERMMNTLFQNYISLPCTMLEHKSNTVCASAVMIVVHI